MKSKKHLHFKKYKIRASLHEEQQQVLLPYS